MDWLQIYQLKVETLYMKYLVSIGVLVALSTGSALASEVGSTFSNTAESFSRFYYRDKERWSGEVRLAGTRWSWAYCWAKV